MKTLDRVLKACWDAAWAAKDSHFKGPRDRDVAYAAWRRTIATDPVDHRDSVYDAGKGQRGWT